MSQPFISKITFLLVLGLQTLITFFSLLIIYMIMVVLDYQGGIDGFIGVSIIQPMIGAILSIITIMICFIIGIPVRFYKKLNEWWQSKFFIAFIGSVIGFILIITALIPSMRETIQTDVDGETIMKTIPNVSIFIAGWFCAAFNLLHLYPPQKITAFIRSRFENLIKN